MLTLLSPDGTRVPAAETTPDADTPHGAEPRPGLAPLPGTATPSPDQIEAYAAELTPERLREDYRHMVRVRAFDQEATNLQRQGELGLWVPCRGQEAAQVGSAFAVPEQDWIVPSYREHAVAAVRGIDPLEILPVFRGTTLGVWDPADHRFSIYTWVIGAQTLHAVGRAMALQQDARRGIETGANAVVCYLGDGATSQGDTNEALVFAASAQAPVLFIVQNNHWAISVPTTTQSRVPLAQRGAGFGIPHLRVDGNDLLATYAATRYALDEMAGGGGPFLIEAVTYRMGAHTTSDDPTRYRTDGEVAEWAAKDPIARLRAYLEQQGEFDGEFAAQVDEDAAEMTARTRTALIAAAAGPFEEIFDGVYASPHSQVDRDRAERAAYLQRGESA